MKKIGIVFLLAALSQAMFSQKVTFSGNVYGFLGEKVLLLKKASKNVSFEGPVSGVRILIKGVNVETHVSTNIMGAYSFTLSEPGVYVIDISKNGYSSVWFLLKYESVGQKTNFPMTSFILKNEDNSINDLGELLIQNDGVLSFKPSSANQKKMNAEVIQSNTVLITKCIELNNSSKQNIEKQEMKQITQHVKLLNEENPKLIQHKLTEDSVFKQVIQAIGSISIDSTASSEKIEKQLDESKKALALIDPSSENYAILRVQIANVENQLKVKEQFINAQRQELEAQHKKVIYLSLLCVFAVASALLLFNFLREKKKHNLILDEKNKHITKINARILSSIQYASVIQSSFFKDKKLFTRLFPQSFIYNQPKDFLSGDFYWFGHINQHKIIAVGDCTGHGVPGALLTMLGHRVLEDIVNIQGQVIPSKILFELNKAIISAFSNQTQIEYGIDITIVSIKDDANELLFSGITNGLYQYSDEILKQHKVTAKTIGLSIEEKDLIDQRIAIKKGDCFYLMTDGYGDQFGKQTSSIEKFNMQRMNVLLNKISKDNQFTLADDVLDKELSAWKGERNQTDDILVVGLKI